MGSQSFWLGDLVGLEGPAVQVGRVDNSASLQMGRGESMGAIPEVQVVDHLVDPGVGHPMDPEVGRLVDPEWAAWWTWRWATWRIRWLVVPIWGARKWTWWGLIDWIGTEVLAEVKHWGRLSGSNGRFPVEGRMP